MTCISLYLSLEIEGSDRIRGHHRILLPCPGTDRATPNKPIDKKSDSRRDERKETCEKGSTSTLSAYSALLKGGRGGTGRAGRKCVYFQFFDAKTSNPHFQNDFLPCAADFCFHELIPPFSKAQFLFLSPSSYNKQFRSIMSTLEGEEEGGVCLYPGAPISDEGPFANTEQEEEEEEVQQPSIFPPPSYFRLLNFMRNSARTQFHARRGEEREALSLPLLSLLSFGGD